MTTPTPETGRRKKRGILIVDDHPIVRQGLALLISQEGDLEVCAEASGAGEALAAIEKHAPDLAIVDLSLKYGNGLELIKQLKGRFPELPALVVSMHDETLYAERALRAGAKGYIMKQEATENVVSAVKRVLSGEIYVSRKMSAKLMEKFIHGRAADISSPLERLSDRELEVFQLIGRGLPTRRIAEMLHLSVKTIETHRAHIKEKLKLKNASELVQHAVHWTQNLNNKKS